MSEYPTAKSPTVESRTARSRTAESGTAGSPASEIGHMLSGVAGDREEKLRRVSDLFVARSVTLAEAHVAVFDEVIQRLSEGIEFRVRVALSEKLSALPNAPKGTVRALAFDEHIEVAAPVIRHSPRLTEEDLIQLAEERGQDHLAALSRRATLSKGVTDVLVRRGGERVVRLVAGNDGAEFSQRGFSTLLEKARTDVVLQRMLQTRCDLPAREMALLVEIAREKVRETLRQCAVEAMSDLIDATVDDVAVDALRNMKTRSLVDDYGDATIAVAQRVRFAPLDESDIVEMLETDRIDEAIVALANLADTPAAFVGRAYHAGAYDPLLFIVRAAGLRWETLQLFLIRKAGGKPSPTMLAGAKDAFEELVSETAMRLVRLNAAKAGAGTAADAPGRSANAIRDRAQLPLG